MGGDLFSGQMPLCPAGAGLRVIVCVSVGGVGRGVGGGCGEALRRGRAFAKRFVWAADFIQGVWPAGAAGERDWRAQTGRQCWCGLSLCSTRQNFRMS